MHFPSAQVGYIITQNGTIYRTEDGGHNWNASSTNATGQLTSVYFINDTLGYIAGMNGLLMKTFNGGQTWTTENTGISENLEQLYFADSGIGYIRTESAKLYKNGTNGVENPEETSEDSDCIGIFPNPVKDKFTLSICTPNQVVSARIISNQGTVISQWSTLSNKGQLDVSQLKPGVYLLQVEVNNTILTKRFIKE